MAFCPECGQENPTGAKFCQFCGQHFPETSAPPNQGAAAGAPPAMPPGHAQYQQSPAGAYGQPGAQVPPVQRAAAKMKNPVLGGFLGFINFGLGAFYNGQTAKGIVLLITTLVFGGPTWYLSPLLGLIFGAAFAYDGYKISSRINNGETVSPWQFFQTGTGRVMFCNSCGAELLSGAGFCNQCGAAVGPISGGAEPPAAPPAPPAPTGYFLHPSEFICPTDKGAMQTLQSMGELNKLIQSFVHKYGKPWLEAGFLGNGVKISPRQFPMLYALAGELAEIFCLNRLPDIYAANLMMTPVAMARTSRSCTMGTEAESFIVLDARYLLPLADERITLEKLRQDHLYYMLAHEMSHVVLGHALYLSMALWVTEHGPTGLAGLTVRPMVLPLQHWARQAVLSADRGVLVATGAFEAYRNYLLTLLLGHHALVRQLDLEAYLEQLTRIDEGAGRHTETLSNTSPYISRRIAALNQYVCDPGYLALRSRVDQFVTSLRS